MASPSGVRYARANKVSDALSKLIALLFADCCISTTSQPAHRLVQPSEETFLHFSLETQHQCRGFSHCVRGPRIMATVEQPALPLTYLPVLNGWP